MWWWRQNKKNVMVQKLYRHGFWVQCGRGFDQDFQDLRIFRINEQIVWVTSPGVSFSRRELVGEEHQQGRRRPEHGHLLRIFCMFYNCHMKKSRSNLIAAQQAP